LTVLEQWKQLAKAENKRMIEYCGGRSLNYGIPQEHTKGSGKPRMSEIERSNPAKAILRLAQQGFSVAETARITGSPVEIIISRARRYQIKFKEDQDG
jgi:transcriptional regulator with GAF, ATPase, and Fis domain